MKFPLKIILFFFILNASGQTEKTSRKKSIHKIEEYILSNKLDSASYLLRQVKEDSYIKVLRSITNKETISYKDQYRFFSNVSNRQSIQFEKITNYVNTRVKEPSGKKINSTYVLIKWTQVSKLRNEISLEEASTEQKKLESYINKFDDSNIDVKKAKIRATTHPIVMYQIQEDVKNGKKLCLESLEKAKKINDKTLQIVFLYHLSDFLLIERKLQEYIDVSEESLKLGNELPVKTSYYYSIIEHLIDAYIFKGGSNDKALKLIDILNNHPPIKIQSYTLYAKLVAGLKNNSLIKKSILEKFEVTNVLEFIKKIEVLGKNLNPNDFLHLINASSGALVNHGFYKEAISYKDKVIRLTQKIYSQDLSKSLASFKTEQAVKEKEKEIAHEKEKTTLYGVIALLAIILLLITLLVLKKIKKQSKELTEKNKIIKETLKEKELLVKEVHHRVKNNFQIVSSLLELQTKGIEDEKALELANEGKNRVKSMALIHQKLYQNESGLVDFDEYIKLLVKELQSMYSYNNQIQTNISSKDMMFDVDTAIPLGLIINEIITNSYKYAFRNDKENNLSISINKENDNNYKLTIEDNGPGISKSLDVKKAKSLGLRLINRLVKQLHGSVSQTNIKGAKFEILFKDNNARQLVD